MNDRRVWNLLAEALGAEIPAAILWVVEHRGSSPGRQGFKMAVVGDGRMAGSVGGGIMEHKLVELALERMNSGIPLDEIRRQIHSKEAPAEQSGMICSGEQTLLLRILKSESLPVVEQLASQSQAANWKVILGPGRFEVKETMEYFQPQFFMDESGWTYQEPVGLRNKVLVVGGGHVGQALCKLMKMLDWHVVNIDDRPALNTMEENLWADEKVVLDYEQLGAWKVLDGRWAVVLVSFGYRTDEICLRQLVGRQFHYLGMMGSRSKVDKMMENLRQDGIDPHWLAGVHAPAGLEICSQTPMEIAVSIAAELIASCKSDLQSGDKD